LRERDVNSDAGTSGFFTTTLSGDHRFQWRPEVSLSEFGSTFFSRSENSSLSGASTTDVAGWQLSGTAQWRPADIRWGGSASARAGYLQNDASEFNDQSVSVSASFRPVGALRYIGGASVSRSASDESEQLSAAENISVSYSPESIEFREYRYRWRGSATGSFSQDDEGSRESVNTSAGHSLDRNWDLAGRSSVRFNADQQLSYPLVDDGEFSNPISFSQRMSLSWSRRQGDLSDRAQLTLSDGREFVGSQEQTQLFNLEVNRSARVSKYSSWSVDATYQASRQVDADGLVDTSQGFFSTGRASTTYRLENVMGVFNLSFRSSLHADMNYQLDEEVSGEVRRGIEWNNDLTYALGRISALLSVDVNHSDDRNTGSFLFTLARRWDSR
jgi:hypothetical protein